MVGTGRKPGQLVRTNGAWLVTKHDDGTTTREALLTFNPFARPWVHQGGAGPRDRGDPLAWARERMRFLRHRRAEAARRAAQGGAVPR